MTAMLLRLRRFAAEADNFIYMQKIFFTLVIPMCSLKPEVLYEN